MFTPTTQTHSKAKKECQIILVKAADNIINYGFIDTFREFNKEPNHYSWWSYRANARVKNLGWRIDYNMITESLLSRINKAEILSKINHSDHCPVLIELAD